MPLYIIYCVSKLASGTIPSFARRSDIALAFSPFITTNSVISLLLRLFLSKVAIFGISWARSKFVFHIGKFSAGGPSIEAGWMTFCHT